jgi:Protein of unknown function (DUF2510)
VSQAPGWYRDPFFRGQERYWDGRLWTQGTRTEGADTGPESQPAAAEPQPVALPGPEPQPGAPSAAAPPPGADLAALTSPDPTPAPVPPAAPPSFAPLGSPAQPVAPVMSVAVVNAPDAVASRARHAASAPRTSRRRAVFAIGAAALLLVGGGIAAALVLGQPAGNASASEAVANAATQTIDAQSADMTMSMNMSMMGFTENVSGNGAFDFANHTANMTMNFGVAGKQFTEQAIYDGTTAYVNMGGLLGDLGSNLTQGKSWISMDLSRLESASGNPSGLGEYEDPGAMLQQLQKIGSTVTSLGATTYDGTAVTEYSVSIPSSVLQQMVGQLGSTVSKALSGNLPNINEDVYITPDNLLKAIHMPMSFSVEGQQVSMDMTMELSNYGTAVNVTPPPASEVIPISGLGDGIGSSLGGVFGNTGSTGNTGDTGSGTL